MWGYVVAVIFLLYLLPHVLVALLPTQNLKKKARQPPSACCSESSPASPSRAQYGATWALVTGASSGKKPPP